MVVKTFRRAAGALAILGAFAAAPALGCTGRVDVAGACEPGEQQLCYTGPEGTEGVGQCRSGVRACSAGGEGFGPCTGQILPSAEDCGLPGDEDCNGEAGACTGASEWARRFTGTDYQTLDSLAVTPGGEVVLGASFSGALDAGQPVGILASADKGAAALRLGATGESVSGTLVDGFPGRMRLGVAAAGAVAGAFSFGGSIDFAGQTFIAEGSGDLLVYILSPTGELGYVRQVHGTDSTTVDAVDVTPAGDMLVAGKTHGAVDLGGGPLDGPEWASFLARYAPSGEHVWSQLLDPTVVAEVQFDDQGNVVLNGWYGADGSMSVTLLDANGASLWSKTFAPASPDSYGSMNVAPAPGGGVFVGGAFTGTFDLGAGPVTAKGDYDAFLVKLGPGGEYLWGKTFGTGDPQFIYDVACDAAGNVALTASFRGTIDFGAGALYSSSTLADDAAVAKLGPDGAPLWSRRFGEGSDLLAWSIVTDAEGAIYLGGDVLGDIDFGTGPLPGTGHADVFVAKLAP